MYDKCLAEPNYKSTSSHARTRRHNYSPSSSRKSGAAYSYSSGVSYLSNVQPGSRDPTKPLSSSGSDTYIGFQEWWLKHRRDPALEMHSTPPDYGLNLTLQPPVGQQDSTYGRLVEQSNVGHPTDVMQQTARQPIVTGTDQGHQTAAQGRLTQKRASESSASSHKAKSSSLSTRHEPRKKSSLVQSPSSSVYDTKGLSTGHPPPPPPPPSLDLSSHPVKVVISKISLVYTLCLRRKKYFTEEMNDFCAIFHRLWQSSC